MVTHQRGVGLVTLKQTHHPKWALIKAVRPDVLVATEETYTQAEITELEASYCGRVKVLERMATVSTSARLRDIIMANPATPATRTTRPRCAASWRRPPGHGADRPMKQVLLYLPVVHAGHEAFFARHPDAAEILLLGAGFQGRVQVPGQGHQGAAA